MIESGRLLNECPEFGRHLSIFDRGNSGFVATGTMRARSPTVTVSATAAFITSSASSSSLLMLLLVWKLVAFVRTTKHGQFAPVAVDDDVKDMFPECRLDLLGVRKHNVRQDQSFIVLPQSSRKKKTDKKR